VAKRMRRQRESIKTLTKDKFLSDADVETLKETIKTHPTMPERTRVLFELALRTGARAAELLDLRLADVNPDGKTIFIYGLKKGYSREIPIPPVLWQKVRNLAEKDPEGLVFRYSYEWLKKEWAKYRPNKTKRFHALRHTFGVRLYKKTRDIHLVKTAMGHKSLISTQVYVDFTYSQSELRKVLDVK